MLDILRMDLFRMRKMRAFFVTLIVASLLMAISTFTEKLMRDAYKKLIEEDGDTAAVQELEEDEDAEALLNEDPEVEDMSKPYVDQIYASYISGMFPALMIVIFTVLFVNADHVSGFIKSIGGQVRHRWHIVVSKIICILLYTLIMLLFLLCLQTVLNLVFFGEVSFNDTGKLITYIMLGFLMNGAFAMMAAAITIFSRSNLIGLLVSILDALGMFNLIAMLVNLLLGKADIKFDLNKYMLSYCINQVHYGSTFSSASHELIVAGCFFAVCMAGSLFIFKKKDIA